MGVYNSQHGYIACRENLKSTDYRVVAVEDPPDRIYNVEMGNLLWPMPSDLDKNNIKIKFADLGVLILYSPRVPLTREIARLITMATVAIRGHLLMDCAAQQNETMIAIISHELRTPLNAIVGLTQLLSSCELNQTELKWANIAYKCSLQMAGIVSDILDYSKMMSGSVELTDNEFNLEECITSAHDISSASAQEHGIKLKIEISPKCPRAVIGDKSRIIQIIVNLVNNSLKFTERGQITTKVCMSGSNLMFEVEDTGIGIAAKNFELIFESFTRLTPNITPSPDDPHYRNSEGSGLGLAICRKLVSLMGGTISVKFSEIGKGTIIAFTIPTRIPPVSTASMASTSTALIIEPDSGKRMLLFRYLSQLHTRPIMCCGDDEAITILNECTFDYVITTKDATQALQALRDTPACVVDTSTLDLTNPGCLNEFITTRKPKLPRHNSTIKRQVWNDTSILIAEDVASNIIVLSDTLKKMGYQHIDTVRNGLQAVEVTNLKQYHVILMDLMMPGMDGVDASRIIIDNCKTKGIKPPFIIPVTAHVTQPDKRRCQDAGMTGFIVKPINYRELESLMLNLVYKQNFNINM